MPSRQVHDVLDWILAFHQQLADRFQSLAKCADDERVQLMFEDMGKRELRIAKSISEYEKGASSNVLNTWLQFGSETELPKVLDVDHLDATLEPPAIVERALEIDDVLVELYRELEGSTSVPELDELFASLVALEESKQHHYAWVLSELTRE